MQDTWVHQDLFGGRGQVRVWDLLRGAAAPPFTAALACELAPGGVVGEHQQQACPELLICTAGAGRAWIDGEALELEPGAALYLPLGGVLRLENLSPAEPLAYLIVKAEAAPPSAPRLG